MSGVCPHLCPLTRARCSDSIKPIRASGGSERRRWSVASHALATGLERFDNGMTVNLWQMRELDDMRGIAVSGGWKHGVEGNPGAEAPSRRSWDKAEADGQIVTSL